MVNRQSYPVNRAAHHRTTTTVDRSIPTLYPLSPMQQGMLLKNLDHPHGGVDIEQVIVTLGSAIDPPRLVRAWQQIMQRHAILNSRIVDVETPHPQLVVHSPITLELIQQDWSAATPAQQTIQLESLLLNDRRQGFNLLNPATPLLRFHLIQLAATQSKFIWTFHHLLLDGRSIAQVLQEAFTVYAAMIRDETLELPPAGQYATYLQWHQQQDFRHAQPFWQDQLQGFHGATPLLPPQASCDLATEPGHQTVAMPLSPVATKALVQLAQAHQITPNTIVQGIWGLLLSRYSGQTDVVFGTIRAGRQLPISEAKSIVGLLINTVPVRVQADPQQTFIAYLQDLRSQHLAMRPHEHTPLMQIQAWSEIPGGTPLFESLVMFENHQIHELLQQYDGSWADRQIELREQPSFPLVLIAELGQSLQLKVSYDQTRCDRTTIRRLCNHLHMLLTSAIANPQQLLGDIPWLTAAETDQLLRQWNHTERDYARNTLIYELFEQQVVQRPQAIALVYADRQLTYGELNHRSNQLAHFMVSQGLLAGEPVGVYLDRGFELIIALMAVVKAGGAYVPFEPSWPDARVAWIVESLNLRYMVSAPSYHATLSTIRDQVPQLEPIMTLSLTTARSATAPTATFDFDRYPSMNLDRRTTPQQPAYIIFTSGSTGVPKGVVVHHQPVINLIEWVNREFNITAHDRGLFITSVCFDLSVYDIFGLLAAGASLQIASNDQVQDPYALLQLIQTTPITFWNSAPPTLQQLVPLFTRRQTKRRQTATPFDRSTTVTERRWAERRQITPTQQSQLRLVFLSGDWVPTTLPDWLQAQFPAVQVVSLGGATEATVWSNFYVINQVDPSWRSIPYGKPIQNSQYYILDQQLQPCPVGVTGELYIGGDCLAMGYTDRAKTQAQFIPHPWNPDATARLYRTGDLARFFPDGNIEFLGRLDHQVKIRGFRIELGEIESVLMQHPLIETAIVLAQPHPGGQQHDHRLVAYVIPKASLKTAVDAPSDGTLAQFLAYELPTFLRGYLPTYMLPSAIVEIDQIPLTPNGKLDRQALCQRLPDNRAQVNDRPPTNDRERQLVAIWQSVLGVPTIGCDDNFFELGGHSLLAVELVAQIEAVCDRQLSLSAVFRAPTVTQMAQLLQADVAPEQMGLLIPVKSVTSPKPPLFWSQFYDEIAQHLPDDQPVYGLDAGVFDIHHPEDHLERWANQYVKQIQTVQPHGPYYLGGYCFGGYLALAIAQQLQQQGEVVDLLLLLESYGPNVPFYQSVPTVRTIALNLLSLKRRLQEQYRRRWLTQHHTAADRGRAQQHFTIPRAPIQAAVQHYPLTHYDGDVLLIGGNTSHLGSRFLPQLGWGKTFHGKAPIQSVAGGHLSLLESPYIEPIAASIQATLANKFEANKFEANKFDVKPFSGKA